MNSIKTRENAFKAIYKRLYKHYGPQHWWPGDTRLEIIVGAILTQNTSWANVGKAIKNLKDAELLSSPVKLLSLGARRLARLIRPAGYYNIKAERVRNFLKFLGENYGASLKKMSFEKTEELRRQLLQINGIGPETCDSILLYAFKRPVFVVDAYTKRIFSRHGIFGHDLDYDGIQRIFMSAFPSDEKLFNEYHALIVRLGKEFCKSRPKCEGCPLHGH